MGGVLGGRVNFSLPSHCALWARGGGLIYVLSLLLDKESTKENEQGASPLTRAASPRNRSARSVAHFVRKGEPQSFGLAICPVLFGTASKTVG